MRAAIGRLWSMRTQWTLPYYGGILFATAHLMSLQLRLVQLGNSLDLLKCHWTLAQWTAGIHLEPFFDASSMKVVPDVARQGCHEGLISEVHQADKARFLRLKHIWVKFDAEKLGKEVFSGVEAVVLMLMVLIDQVNNVGSAQNTHCQEKCCEKGRQDSKNDHYFVVELE